MLASALREMFGVQLYKNNARALLLRILSIPNLDWLQHARQHVRSVRGVYELILLHNVGCPILSLMRCHQCSCLTASQRHKHNFADQDALILLPETLWRLPGYHSFKLENSDTV